MSTATPAADRTDEGGSDQLPSRPLKERLRRRSPGFREGVRFVLDDGDGWYFPKPEVYTRPVAATVGFSTTERVEVRGDFDPSYGVALQRYEDYMGRDPAANDPRWRGTSFVREAFSLVYALASVNYDLSAEEFSTLVSIPRRPTPEGEENRFGEIMDVARGLSGKETTPAG